ncbi:unnamed protein product [Prunus brigantina]
MFGAQLLDKGLIWRLGKGDKVKFWRDKRISDVPMMQTVDLAPDLNLNSLVSDFFVNDWWDVEKLRSVLPEEWVQKVTGCSADFQGLLEDCQIWKRTSNGLFSVKSYSLLFQGANWLNPWRREKILSNEQRVRRPLTGNCAYDYYKWPIESTLHILRDCSRARKAIIGTNSGANKVQVLLAWVPPEIGVVKLNIDGSRRGSTSAIGPGGVLNDCHPNVGLVNSCKRLLNLFRRIKLQHIYRERNDVADGLAAWSHNLNLGCYYFEESPA